MLSTADVLSKLISLDTTSRNSNLELIDYVVDLFEQHGIESTVLFNDDKTKANLYATIGSGIGENKAGGVMLSGHTDVVPIDGQDWNVPAFTLTEQHERYYGRGTTDMKGFVACAIVAAISAQQKDLQSPLHIAFSYDEEIGCVGVHSLVNMLKHAPIKPAMCIVGEPTLLQVATKHKGKTAIVAHCIGNEGHSALAPNYQNAIHLACDLIGILRDTQTGIANAYTGDDKSDIPYTTVHVGRVNTTQALNIVPSSCTVHFEIRHPESDDPLMILEQIKSKAKLLEREARLMFDDAAIRFEVTNAYPALDTPVNSEVVQFVRSLVDEQSTGFVAFGTEGGLFAQTADIPTVVCGPGSMDQGHKPDEYLEISQVRGCEKMLSRLIEKLVTQST